MLNVITQHKAIFILVDTTKFKDPLPKFIKTRVVVVVVCHDQVRLQVSQGFHCRDS